MLATGICNFLSVRFWTDSATTPAAGDWGEIGSQDAAENDWSLSNEGRLMSAYRSGDKTFWIITEWDRSVTTILMPEDY